MLSTDPPLADTAEVGIPYRVAGADEVIARIRNCHRGWLVALGQQARHETQMDGGLHVKYRKFRSALRAVLWLGVLAPLTLNAATGPALTGVTATAKDASTSASNPAGLTRLKQPEWMGSLMAFYSKSEFETTASGSGASLTDDTDGSLFVPSAYYARPYNEDITLGVSLTVPAGVGQNPGDATAGRYLLDEWSLGYVSLAPAVGYRLNEQLSVGAALNFNYAAYKYETAVYNGPDEADGHMELSDGDFGFGFQLGLLYELSPNTRLGLTYRSSTETEFSDAPELTGLTPEREALLEQGIRSKEIGLQSEFPQIVAAGVYHEFGNGRSATLDVAWIDFSEFGLTDVKLDDTAVTASETQYEDMWAASAGYNWPVNDDWTMRVGMAYLSSGVEDENRSFSFRLDRIIGAGVGAEYRWGSDKVLGVNLTYYDLGEAPVQNDVPQLGTVSGEYSDNYAVGLDVSLRWIP